MPKDTITHQETSDPFSDLDDFACEVRTEDTWVLDPGQQEVAEQRYEPIDRVDGDGVVLENEIVLTRGNVRRGLDFELVIFVVSHAAVFDGM